MEVATGERQFGPRRIGLVAKTEVLEVGGGLESVLSRAGGVALRRQSCWHDDLRTEPPLAAVTHLGHNIVEEVKLDASSRLITDGNVKVCDGVGHFGTDEGEV